jgi:uncharacterized protein involved in exopolysaccharide biosynthesis
MRNIAGINNHFKRNNKTNQNIMETTTDRSLDFRRYTREVRRIWWIYAVAFVAIVGAASIFIIRSFKQSEAEATILIEESTSDTSSASSKGGGLMGMMKMFSVGGFGSSSVNNEIYLINSHDMAVRTVKALGLNTRYIDRSGLKKELLFPNSPIKASMPEGTLDTLKRGFMLKVVLKPNGHVNAKAVKGPFFWRTTLDEITDATLPAKLTTPYGEVTLSAGNMPHPADEDMNIDVIISGADKCAHELLKKLDADIADKLSDAIDLSFSGASDEYCVAVLSEYINQYNKRRIERRAENAMNELEFYDARIADLFGDLTDSEQKLEKFKTDNKLVSMQAEAELLVDNTVGKMEDLAEVRTTQEYYRMVKRTLENPSSGNELIPVVESLGNPMIATYNELVLSRKNLERSAKGNNPQLVALNEQISELRTSILKNVDGMLTQGNMRLNAMSGLMGTASSRLNKMPAYEREYINLTRERTTKNELYMFLLQKRENAALQVSSNSTLGFVIDPAHTPEKVSPMKNIVIILAALLMSLLLPTILIIYRVKRRNAVEDAADLAAINAEPRAHVVSDDAASIAELRAELLATPSKTAVFVANLAEGNGLQLVSRLAESIEKIGHSVSVVSNLADNDTILNPAFASQLNANGYTFVQLPDNTVISAYAERFNADDATLLLIVNAGEQKRSYIKRLLRGIYADTVVTAIIK